MAAQFLVQILLDRAAFRLADLEGDLDVASNRLGELVELLLVQTRFERGGECLDPGLDGGGLAVDRIVGGFGGGALGQVAQLEQPLLGDSPVKRSVSGGENRRDRVIVFMADRVVLVTVAPGTAERETQERRIDHLYGVGKHLGAVRGKVMDRAIGRVDTGSQKARRDQVIGQGRRKLSCVQVIFQLVAGELFQQEAIVWLI